MIPPVSYTHLDVYKRQPHQRPILRLGVADDDVVIREQIDAEHFTFGGEALAGAGDAQDKAVGVLLPQPVYHDEVAAEGVHSTIRCV